MGLGDIPQNVYYMQDAETVSSDAAALSTSVCTSYLAVDATDAHTLAAPSFKGQFKHIATVSAANTPVCTVTVTGMRQSGANVFAGFGTISDSAPKSLTLHSPDGVSWNIWAMVGVTVS